MFDRSHEMMKRAKRNYSQLWKVMSEQFFC